MFEILGNLKTNHPTMINPVITEKTVKILFIVRVGANLFPNIGYAGDIK